MATQTHSPLNSRSGPWMLVQNTSQFAWGTLIYLLAVIAWGAFVRASGSGAGCGSHWPLCNGEVLPLASGTKTWIEFTHRATSGLSLIFCLVLFWSAFRNYPKGSLTRKGACASLIMIFIEALLGAGLVLLELVADNKSSFRAFSLGIHLVSTFFLLATVVLTARWAQQELQGPLRLKSIRFHRSLALTSFAAVLGFLLLGSSGAMTALGDTLFPSSSLRSGLTQDISSTSHFLIQLRILHPMFAVAVSCFIFFWSYFLRRKSQAAQFDTAKFSTLLAGSMLAQLFLGLLNILFLVPIPIQLLHLLLADVIWIFLVLTVSSIWVESSDGTVLSGYALGEKT